MIPHRLAFAFTLLGLLSQSTLAAPPREFFEKLDTNHDGRISLEEFYPTGPPPLHPRMKQVFESFDKDHRGTLSYDDAAKTIATVSGVLPKLTPDATGGWGPVELQVHPRTHRAFVKATVNGTEGTFLLDTGTTDTIVHPDFAKRAGVDFVEICQTVTAGNMGKRGDIISLVRIPSLKLGDTTFRDFHAVLRECKQPTYEFGKPIDGLIGASIIYAKPVTLDFGNGKLIYQPLPSPDGCWVFPLRKDAKVAITEAEVDGVKLPLMMDSGAAIGDAIMINQPYHDAIRKLAGDPHAAEYRAKVLTVDGRRIATDLRCVLQPFEHSVFSSGFFGNHVISVDLAAAKAVVK